MPFQIQVTGLDPIVKAITRAAIALEGILTVLKVGADAGTIAAIEENRLELKTSSDDLAASVAAASDPKP